MIAKYCGRIESPLSNDSLHTLQAGILGHDAFGLGLRRSPVFVGQATMREEIVHYIAPAFDGLPHLLGGLEAFELATRGAEPLARRRQSLLPLCISIRCAMAMVGFIAS